MTHTTTVTIDGHTYTAVSTRTPAQMARYEHLCPLLVHEQPDDGMTAADWQAVQTAATERAQQADDAALYGTGRDGNDRGVGY